VSLYWSGAGAHLFHGDALEELKTFPDQGVNCIVTSPPYFGLRDYGLVGQLGLEASPDEYTKAMRTLFAEVRRVLVNDGTLWLNIGDSYYSGKGNPGPNAADGKQPARRGWKRVLDQPGAEWARPKNLLGIPWRVAFALQDDGWILRNAIVWHKPNAMPESVRDRLSCRYEMVFMFSKSKKYWFDLDPIREELKHPEKVGHAFGGNNPEVGRRRGNRYGITRPGENREQSANRDAADPRGRNPGDVWSISTRPFAEAHFAVMTPDLAERCILAGCPPDGLVLDPFSGSGTTGMVALRNGRRYVGVDLSQEYLDLSIRTRFGGSK
jgi:DNA modification methylase